ncbi:MAG TPA: hypothetical protein VKF61_11840 [Candidatus Polarisedimenticolia bacterium]|nr:hypothetical protein [Candidatus Polarisedimenticolia bacterium]
MTGRLVRRSDLGDAERASMFALLSRHFEGVTRRGFESDLGEKNWVVVLEEAGRLVGFSTLLIYEGPGGGEPLTVVYSGDTIMERGAWNTAALPGSWIAAVRTLREWHPAGRLYWLLLTSGFRTYRFLPVFWREFHPRHDAPMLPETAALLSRLAADRLGASFLPASGTARLPRPQVLKPELRFVPEGRSTDPHIAFFLERNPGWVDGDELVCLTEIAYENLTPAGRRMWTRGRCEVREMVRA